MGDSQSKQQVGKRGLEGSSSRSTFGKKTQMSFEARRGDNSVSRQTSDRVNNKEKRLQGLRRFWQEGVRLKREARARWASVDSDAVSLDALKSQQQSVSANSNSSGNDLLLSADRKLPASARRHYAEDDLKQDGEEFTFREVKLPDDANPQSPLFRAYANSLGFMEEDVVTALARHPCPNEALRLIYICCSAEPLPVEHSVEPNSEILAYVLPGTYLKVLEFTTYRTQFEYLLRLKTAEGWVTGASIKIMRVPHSPRLALSKASGGGPFTSTRSAGAQRVPPPKGIVSFSHKSEENEASRSLKNSSSASAGAQGNGCETGRRGSRAAEDADPTACWGVVNACRVTRFCSFQTCLRQTKTQACYTRLSKFASVSAMQSFGAALLDNTPGFATNAGTAQARDMSCIKTGEPMQQSDATEPSNNLTGNMSLMDHPFLLFRVVAKGAIPVSANPHLASPVVGRLLHRQVFPVIDACLACCTWSCSLFDGDGDCLISGASVVGQGASDVVHAMARNNLTTKKARRRLNYFSRTRSMQLRVCTPQGWVTFDRSIEKVDECDTVYEHPVPYEIVADGYLVNVRASLEVEGPVRRTLPPASLVEVYERKVNAEGLMRLRLVDGWINERRKGANDAGLLFAVRGGDYRAAAFVKQMTATLVLLPALCSSDNNVRTAAATWVAANVARSAIASTALMDEVDETIVEEELNRCHCCYCRGCNSSTNKGESNLSLTRDDSSQRQVNGLSSKDQLPLVGEPQCENGAQALECTQSANNALSYLKPQAAGDMLLPQPPLTGDSPASPASRSAVTEPQSNDVPSLSLGEPATAALEVADLGSAGMCAQGPISRRASFGAENACNKEEEDTAAFNDETRPMGQPLGDSGSDAVEQGDTQPASSRQWGPPCPHSSVLHCASSPELGMGLAHSHDFAVRRETLSPTDKLYQFCVAAVYSSLAEQREAVGSQVTYRPPVGAYVPPSSRQRSLLSKGGTQQSLLAAYMAKQLNAKGKLPVVNLNRCSSFSFHQPLVIVIHKVERICNEFLTRRYLHERSMLLLLNRGSGGGIEEAIPNPLLKEALNEYFLFHGCTEERAALIALSGFDFRRGGENGGKLFGVGTYFSPNASKADLYARPAEVQTRPAGQPSVKAATSPKPPPPLRTNVAGQQPLGRAAVGLAALRGIHSYRLGLMQQNADLAASKNAGIAGSQPGGHPLHIGCVNSTPVAPIYPAPCPWRQPMVPRNTRERGGLLAVYAKLRHGTSRNKDNSDLASRPSCAKSANANPQQPRAKQTPGATDGGVPKARQGRAQGAAAPSAPTAMRCLLVARVCLGEVYKTLSTMPDARMPPNKPDPIATKLAHDSIMAECRARGGVVDAVEFVVFERAQALPQFIVTYSHAPHCQCAECHRQAAQ
ncbi:hypothetical protein Emed_004196 [Eimeria media]